MSSKTQRIGLIGAGKMATALAQGWLAQNQVTSDALISSDPIPEALQSFALATGARTSSENQEVVDNSDVLVLAVKPQVMNSVLDGIASLVTQEHLVISIAAGVTLSQIQQRLGDERRLVRVMPNTPCLINAGAAGFALGGVATPEDAKLVQSLLECTGIAFELPERLLNAVTGLSGSGPAYVYQMIEALSDGGVKVGLPRNVATQLAAQTLLGAAKMVLELQKHPGELKDMVTSPGGTTIAGLAVMESCAVRGALIEAVEAATLRAEELSEE